jgi:deoxyadenosine/deoxycytidine kinase
MFAQATVSDFLLDKDQLFAGLTLSDAEHDLYQQIYRHLQPQAPQPDLVIYLQASPNTLVERIKRRGSSFEKNISEDYLWRLAETYTRFFYQFESAPVMIVNSENLNFVDNSEDFDLLLQRIEQMRGSREYFNRG